MTWSCPCQQYKFTQGSLHFHSPGACGLYILAYTYSQTHPNNHYCLPGDSQFNQVHNRDQNIMLLNLRGQTRQRPSLICNRRTLLGSQDKEGCRATPRTHRKIKFSPAMKPPQQGTQPIRDVQRHNAISIQFQTGTPACCRLVLKSGYRKYASCRFCPLGAVSAGAGWGKLTRALVPHREAYGREERRQ